MGAITTVSGTLTVNGPASIEFPDLATQGGFIAAGNAATFSAPKLIDNASISTSSTAAITLKSVSSTVNFTASATMEGLTTIAQATSLDLGLLPKLKTANISGGGTKDSSIALT